MTRRTLPKPPNPMGVQYTHDGFTCTLDPVHIGRQAWNPGYTSRRALVSGVAALWMIAAPMSAYALVQSGLGVVTWTNPDPTGLGALHILAGAAVLTRLLVAQRTLPSQARRSGWQVTVDSRAVHYTPLWHGTPGERRTLPLLDVQGVRVRSDAAQALVIETQSEVIELRTDHTASHLKWLARTLRTLARNAAALDVPADPEHAAQRRAVEALTERA